MLFNSIFFLFVFFPIVTGFYYFLPHRFRSAWLLLVSSYFYMSFIPAYILILAFTITIDYVSGRCIELLSGKTKRYFLIASILSNIGVLFTFKYFNFFSEQITALAEMLHWNYSLQTLELILPIGLSFHTFQALSYIIEVYRGKQNAERNFGIFALYVMFYPQLVAGPIERPQNLLHQFYEKHTFKLGQFMSGMRLILWGLFKKVVIADRISVFVNQIFNNVYDYTGSYFIFATILFAFQIYCDFSGYSDMARGFARTLGFELMVNFNAPYFSKSISEFWQRWHISLSTWFRDYVYISLGGNRVSRARWSINILLTFLLSGLWHGANWTFVIWGGLNGMYMLFSLMTHAVRSKLHAFIGWNHSALHTIVQTACTFALIGFSWIFFRAGSLDDAWYIIGQIFSTSTDIQSLLAFIGLHAPSLLIVACALGLLLVVDSISAHKERFKNIHIHAIPIPIQAIAFSALVCVIALVGKFTNQEFIYFQF